MGRLYSVALGGASDDVIRLLHELAAVRRALQGSELEIEEVWSVEVAGRRHELGTLQKESLKALERAIRREAFLQLKPLQAIVDRLRVELDGALQEEEEARTALSTDVGEHRRKQRVAARKARRTLRKGMPMTLKWVGPATVGGDDAGA